MTHSLKYQYANVSIEELRIMEKINLSGFHTRVYLTIKSFAFGDKKSSFPSYRTIAKALEMESKNFQSLLSRALRKLVSVGLIIKNKPNDKDRFIITSKTSNDNKVVSRASAASKGSQDITTSYTLTNQSRGSLDRTVNRRTKGSNNPSYVLNETELSQQNVERLLFGLIDPRQYSWSPNAVRQEANKWVKENTGIKMEMLMQAHNRQPVDTIVAQRITWFLSHRGYESNVSNPYSYQNENKHQISQL